MTTGTVPYTGIESEEYLQSELPALKQLVAMGYQYKNQSELNRERKDYREVLLYERLERSIRKLNPELYEDEVYYAIGQIREDSFPLNLDQMDANEQVRAKLMGLSRSTGLETITVTQDFGEGNVEKTVRLFDFDNPENNDFLVTNQFQLEGLREPIFPDIVLFVNGIPLVVIECKAHSVTNPVQEAAKKNLYRYQSRGYGFEKLMFYNHLLIATSGYMARHGAVGTSLNHYARWSEAYPLSLQDIEQMCKRKPREQEILIGGMLSKYHILDLLKNYLIYETVNNKKIKKIAKYHQYRVVTKAVDRLENSDEKSVSDKGGVVWHTHGSGKSLSMLWLATKLMYKFGNPPIVIITDRKQLDRQIHETFRTFGFPTPIKAKNSRDLESLLQNPKTKTIMTTIQKFGIEHGKLIHTDQKIIVLVDEGHRIQYKLQTEAMRSAMPNAVFFAFTGTPIYKKDKSTYRVFGPLLDRYSFEESKADGVTLPIFYEARMADLYMEVDAINGIEGLKERKTEKEDIEKIFQRIFSHLPKEEQERLKKEYITRELIIESYERIRKIAADVIKHFTTHIQPNGFKAMLVAPSREAAVTYKRELDKLGGPRSKIIMTSNLGEKGKDGTSWDEYFTTIEQREFESEFFKSPENQIQILIVVDMLLVGYDAPIVQVMYLDHPLREHTLLQAIARVNRPYTTSKTYGLIVDYCGITKELQKTLTIFDEQDVKNALIPIEKEVLELKTRHKEVMSFFSDIADRNNNDLIIEKFEPVHIRDNFEYAFKMFSKSLDAILPRKEAGPYIEDFKYLSQKIQLLKNFYGNYGISVRLEGQKVQQLIDDYIHALRMENHIDFRKVTNETFLVDIMNFKTDKARTALVKNKIRQIIEEKKSENPAYYENIKERMEKLIEEEKKRRETTKYFNRYKEILGDLFKIGKEGKRVYLTTIFENAVYELLLQTTRDDVVLSKKITKKLYEEIKPETEIIGWRTKRDSQKRVSLIIYDTMLETKTRNKHLMEIDEEMITEITEKIVCLAQENL